MVRVVRDPGFGSGDGELPDLPPLCGGRASSERSADTGTDSAPRARRVGTTLLGGKEGTIRKTVSTTLDLADWRLLDTEATRRGTALSKLLAELLSPALARLRAQHHKEAA